MRILATSLVLVICLGGAADAHDHRPPSATFRSGKVEQDGIRITSCWVRGTKTAGAVCSERTTSFPLPVEVRSRPEDMVTFGTDREPERVRIRAWRRLRSNGEPRPPARVLDGTLEQLTDSWDVRFDLPDRPGTWYLEVKGVWPDARFPEDQEFAVWTFAASIRG